MSAAIRIGYVNSPTLALNPLAVLYLNWVMRLASPKAVMQLRIHMSCGCSGTWLCTNTGERTGSTPAAMYWAAVRRVRRRSSFGSVGTVQACRSATK